MDKENLLIDSILAVTELKQIINSIEDAKLKYKAASDKLNSVVNIDDDAAFAATYTNWEHIVYSAHVAIRKFQYLTYVPKDFH